MLPATGRLLIDLIHPRPVGHDCIRLHRRFIFKAIPSLFLYTSLLISAHNHLKANVSAIISVCFFCDSGHTRQFSSAAKGGGGGGEYE